MPTTERTAPPQVTRALRATKIIFGVYAAIGLLQLLINLVLAVSGHGRSVSSFMWGRSAGVLISGWVFILLTVLAGRGVRSAYQRVRIISIVLPIIIVVLVLVPAISGGVPLWFKAAQIAAAVCVAIVAFVVNTGPVRHAFGADSHRARTPRRSGVA